MKKILHVLSSNSYSGAENVAISLIENLSDKFQGIYCSPNGEIEKYLIKKGVKYCLVDEMNVKELKRIIKEIKPDIIHAHDFKASIKVGCLRTNLKIISHIHQNPPWIKKVNFKTIIYTLFSYNFEKIFIVSESIRREFKTFKSIKDKMVNVKNPINISEIILKSQEFAVNDKFDIIYLGRLSKEKNPEFLMQIYHLIVQNKPSLNIGIIGEGEELACMQAMSLKLNIGPNINFLGFKENPFPYIINSRIMIMTSKWEGFGLAAAEAMALGVPVLATPVGGLEELVGNENLLVCNDILEFVEKANYLLDDYEYYAKISEKVKHRIKTKYNIKYYMETIESEYKNIC